MNSKKKFHIIKAAKPEAAIPGITKSDTPLPETAEKKPFSKAEIPPAVITPGLENQESDFEIYEELKPDDRLD